MERTSDLHRNLISAPRIPVICEPNQGAKEGMVAGDHVFSIYGGPVLEAPILKNLLCVRTAARTFGPPDKNI